jgi:hypothetical protein
VGFAIIVSDFSVLQQKCGAAEISPLSTPLKIIATFQTFDRSGIVSFATNSKLSQPPLKNNRHPIPLVECAFCAWSLLLSFERREVKLAAP